MNPRVINIRDLDFLLKDWLGLEAMLGRPRFAAHDLGTIDALLALAKRTAEKELAPYLRLSDTKEPWMDEAGDVHVLPEVASGFRHMAQAGLFGSAFDEAVGGFQLPHLVEIAVMGMLMAGSIATASFMLLTLGNARLIAAAGTAAQIEFFAMPQIAGEATGTMCLSETQAGSSLGDITTLAEPDGEDALGSRFRIRGSKMWISGGDHDASAQIVHLVLAKIPDGDGRTVAGSRGISLFIVPKVLPDGSRNDIRVLGLNHKLGYRGLPNCALNFGDGRFEPGGRSGAVGWLMGETGSGLPQMFQMMNEARIGVGLGGAMLAYRGYLLSVDYARERQQGRAPAMRDGPQIPIAQHPDVKRLLLAQKAFAEGALALVLYSARLLDEVQTAEDTSVRQEAGELLALLTPATKTWPAEWAQQALHLAIQVHGGAGYTRDILVELLYRDNRLNPIHEGTTGIQAMDLVSRKLRRGNAWALLRLRIERCIAAADALPNTAKAASAVSAAWHALDAAASALVAEADESRAMMNATPFLFAFGHVVVGWIWLDMAVTAEHLLASCEDDAQTAFLAGKVRACRYFAAYELPCAHAMLSPVMAFDDVAASMPDAQFLGEAH